MPIASKLRTYSALAIIAAALLLSACGFALRGAVNFPFASIFISYPDGTPLSYEIKRSLVANGATRIATKAKDADVVLEILGESRDKKIVAINGQGRVRAYTLSYGTSFRVINAVGKEFIAPTAIRFERPMTYTEAAALAKENEEAMLYRDMQNDAVRQMMRRLAAMKTD
jgi:LPS-assembly lipoprotein